ncbi:MAG TPA: hypothetical protein VNV82_13120 [Bryobacteraceae bacterium]|jgi:hypothetical protein|nr:hypothetical protein [Bryobacteraceae bacterium]
MQHRLTMAVMLFVSVVPCHAGEKEHDWKTGHVLDSLLTKGPDVTVSNTQTRATGNDVVYGNSGGTENRQQTSTTTTVSGAARVREIFITGPDYLYTLEDPTTPSKTGAALHALFGSNPNVARRARCRFIIGEDIKYWQERGTLHILDADGRPCQVEILRQEKTQPITSPAAK